MTHNITFSFETIQGFFDADGSYEAKVRVGTQKLISFHVNIIFSQKDKDVLQAILNSIGADLTKEEARSESLEKKVISQRVTQNESGTTSITHSISLAFSNPYGKALLKFWQSNPPKAPTKLLDFRIARILAEVKTTTASQVVNKYLPNSEIPNERIASLALLWLRYRMFGKVKKSRNPGLIPIEVYYSELRATPAEIQQSVVIGQQLFAPIQQEINGFAPISSSLSNDYLLGYHIGDGSFQIETIFGPNNQSFKAKFLWTATDCTQNLALLEAIKQKLNSDGIGSGITDYTTYKKLHVSGIENGKKLVDKWKNQKMSLARQNQYDCFKKSIELYSCPNFRQDLVKLEEFIHLKWIMNPGTNFKKKGSEKEDLNKVRIYFNN